VVKFTSRIADPTISPSSLGAMELLDEESHRILLWAVRLHEVGHAPTRSVLAALSEGRQPAGLATVTGLTGQHPEFQEDAIASLLRRGLLQPVGDRGVAPTGLGRRVVDALGLESGFPAFEVFDADLSSSDPLAFARVVGRVAALHRPMLVDPYCRRSELEYLSAHTSVTRVMVSDRLDDDELAELIDFVESLHGRDHKLRLRVADAELISDRCVISGDRVLQVAGLPAANGGGTTVVTEPHDLGERARDYYRDVWRGADRLATYRPRRRSTRAA